MVGLVVVGVEVEGASEGERVVVGGGGGGGEEGEEGEKVAFAGVGPGGMGMLGGGVGGLGAGGRGMLGGKKEAGARVVGRVGVDVGELVVGTRAVGGAEGAELVGKKVEGNRVLK